MNSISLLIKHLDDRPQLVCPLVGIRSHNSQANHNLTVANPGWKVVGEFPDRYRNGAVDVFSALLVPLFSDLWILMACIVG
jgi:hypothetical protein